MPDAWDVRRSDAWMQLLSGESVTLKAPQQSVLRVIFCLFCQTKKYDFRGKCDSLTRNTANDREMSFLTPSCENTIGMLSAMI